MPVIPWILLLCYGCSPAVKPHTQIPEERMIARYSETPVRVDGALDEEVWERTPAYPLCLARDRAARGEVLAEPGEVRLAWDEDHLYLGVRLADSDVVARGDHDQMHHYRLGDVVELFLKPEGAPWYWELYVTPRGRKSSFFLPGRRQLTDRGCGLCAAARVDGTCNDSADRDNGWTAEMAVPLAGLDAGGHPLSPGGRWRILVARYNHGRPFPEPELSTAPPLSRNDFHLLEEYALLELAPPPRPLPRAKAADGLR